VKNGTIIMTVETWEVFSRTTYENHSSRYFLWGISQVQKNQTWNVLIAIRLMGRITFLVVNKTKRVFFLMDKIHF
jgi:hypothetical protein